VLCTPKHVVHSGVEVADVVLGVLVEDLDCGDLAWWIWNSGDRASRPAARTVQIRYSEWAGNAPFLRDVFEPRFPQGLLTGCSYPLPASSFFLPASGSLTLAVTDPW